jgi:small conductance mechanosensitive channel
MDNMEITSEALLGLISAYGPKLLAALLTLFVGLWVANILVDFIKKLLTRSKVDPSLQTFLSSLFGILFKIMVYITALGVLGVAMTSFVAILASAGLAIGLALSGTLQNFAGGVMILFFKTFRVGDVIEAQGHTGTVQEIQIFVTVLTTVDNKTIIVPNGPLATGTLINYSTQPIRRVDWTFAISYGDDVDQAYAVLKQLIVEDQRILADPEPLYAVGALTESAVNIVLRVWVTAADYAPVFFRMNEQVYKRFAQEGLTIPHPQRLVVLQGSASK